MHIDGKLILDSDFLKKVLVKTPHQIDGENVTYHSEETYTILTQPAWQKDIVIDLPDLQEGYGLVMECTILMKNSFFHENFHYSLFFN